MSEQHLPRPWEVATPVTYTKEQLAALEDLAPHIIPNPNAGKPISFSDMARSDEGNADPVSAVREQMAEIDRKSVLVNQLDGFYYGITYGRPADQTYVSEAEFVDACTDAGAHSYQQYGQIYTRLVAAKRGAGTIGGTL